MCSLVLCFLMISRPPITTLTDTRIPCTSLVLSVAVGAGPLAAFRAMALAGRAELPVDLEPHRPAKARTPDRLWQCQFSSAVVPFRGRSAETTSELQLLMRISYVVFCLKKTKILDTLDTQSIISNQNTTIHI